MSVQHKGNGALRLACDGEWCARKFSPVTPITDVKTLRWRATLYGWLVQPEPKQQPSIPGIGDGAAAARRDLCPECRKAVAA